MARAPTSDGFRLYPGRLDRTAQSALLDAVMRRIPAAPVYQPVMPRSGAPMTVRMTNFGVLGWVSDIEGYRYQPRHPDTGDPWPSIPEPLLELWRDVSGWPQPPEACLVNVYGPGSRLGLHVDADEDARDAPVVSVSLGDTAIFRLGGLARRSPTVSFRLSSGDVVVLGGEARRAFHGIDRVISGSSTLVSGGGRINLTLRRVTR
ncbi:alpha-ketoglutarate-dependent dioxygenase AlkB [bacterium]|nr:alpha-ketoglutarate-dependent dioxygenase AlkB [bacterium]